MRYETLKQKTIRTVLLPALVLLVLGLWNSPLLGSQSVTLAWDANPQPDISGYFFYYGDVSQSIRKR